ncbi:MAG: GDP-mannose 4,6-dehydratase [Candidatus Falkowbacteria bacterium]
MTNKIDKKNSKVLVTGGAGFIGSHIALALLKRGDEVAIIDNFNDYYDPNLKEARIRRLTAVFPGIKIYRTDITDNGAIAEIFSKESFDKVCHLAAQAGVRYSLTNPFIYEQTNILGTLNLLESCRHNGVKDFIFASSSSVYGNNKELPFSEEQRVDNPISLYAATKKSNEEMAYVYHHLYGLHCTGLRFFTVYGPWGRPDMALFKFSRAILAGEAIDIYNNGEMARDFTYIDDIVAGAIAAIDKSYPYEIFNLARGESIKLSDFISEIEKNLKKTAGKNMLPLQPGDVPATSASIEKARRMLGYEPRTSVDAGVRNFIEWYREYYKR